MPRAPAGIGFDIDHTLAIDNGLERVAFLRLLDLLLGEGARAKGTLADEIGRVDALLERQRSGACSIDAAVDEFVADHGKTRDDRYAACFRRMAVQMVDEFVIPLPGARHTLEVLQERGFAVVVLSNGWEPLQLHKARRVGFEGPVLASAEIGAQKPALEAFEAMLEALGTAADESWYVGDDPRGDIAGAQAAGVRAVWIDWEKKPYPDDLAPPTHRIHALEELLALLPARAPARVRS